MTPDLDLNSDAKILQIFLQYVFISKPIKLTLVRGQIQVKAQSQVKV